MRQPGPVDLNRAQVVANDHRPHAPWARRGLLDLADQPFDHVVDHVGHLLLPPLGLPRRHALLGRHAPRHRAQLDLDGFAHALAGALLGRQRDGHAVVPQRSAAAVGENVREPHALARRNPLSVALEHHASPRTLAGAVVSITCTALIVLLSLIDIADFAIVKKTDHLFVDTTRSQHLRININISFPALPCSVISLDTLDLSGNHAPDQQRSIKKVRLDGKGNWLPPSARCR